MNTRVAAMPVKKMRDSQFELLRIVAQWCIVFYHLFYDFTVTYQMEHPIYLGIQIPLHIGVILFVLISGYYGIKASVGGVFRLMLTIVVYFLPLALIVDYAKGDYVRLVKDFFIVSYPRYWFFRDYLFLLLFSPVINAFLKNITQRERIYLLAILGFMSIWVGTSMGSTSLAGGKNLTNFILLYVIGNTIHEYKDKWVRIPAYKILAAYLILNVLLFGSWMYFHDSIIGSVIMQLSYPYCSPLIIINSVLVFILFGKMHFHSKSVNWIATSVFAVYLIHYHRYIWNDVVSVVANEILTRADGNPSIVIPLFFALSVLIYTTATLIDKAFTPFWQYTNKLISKIDDNSRWRIPRR